KADWVLDALWYCSRDREGDPGTLVPIIKTAQSGKNKFQTGEGKNLFDFTYVGNAANLHLLAAGALLSASNSKEPIPEQMRVDGEVFFVTNNEPMPFWDFTRSIGTTAGYPVANDQIWVIPKWMGLMIATVGEWVTWATSLGMRRPAMTKEGIRLSCMTRIYRVEKGRKRLGYRPAVNLQEGMKRGVNWWLETQQEQASSKKEK
ncbi:hypothetical protein MMC25_005355, partial [Agyrium rufum]|nr:hypothetical protein [Agyrium rufum]